MSPAYREPELSPAARRIVGALLLSLSAHAAFLGLVGLRNGGPGTTQQDAPLMQVRLGDRPQLRTTPPSVASATHTESAIAAAVPVVKRSAGTGGASAPLAVIDAAPVADPVFYTTRQLDVLPRPVMPIVPRYPPMLTSTSVSGWVLLRLRLDEAGRVLSVQVRASEPAGVFDRSAQQAFSGARFEPGRKDGRAVRSQIEIKIWYGKP